MYSNDSFKAERFYDDMYERHEDARDCTCPECKGTGETEYCMNCGNHCEDCDCDVPELVMETCEKCKGGGEV